jgi:regulatory protein
MTLFDARDPELEKAVQMALAYLRTRPRSVQELKFYLTRKKLSARLISRVIDRLHRYEYLNDNAFARGFIENRIRHHPKSRFALAYELKHKGISSQILEDLLQDYDDAAMAFKALTLKQRHWQHIDFETMQKKAANFLHYRGFGYDACKQAWEQFATGFQKTGSRDGHKE